MRTFRCGIYDLTHHWESSQALSFIARDVQGSFGIQAHHETLVGCLVAGLARLRVQDEGWLYIAQPGSVIVFRDNVLQLSTSQFILSQDRDQLIAQMEQAWQSVEHDVRRTKTSYLQMEQALSRKLWEMNRDGIMRG